MAFDCDLRAGTANPHWAWDCTAVITGGTGKYAGARGTVGAVYEQSGDGIRTAFVG